MEYLVTGINLTDAYHKALVCLQANGDLVDCDDWNTKCLETSMTIQVMNPLAEMMISKCFIGGTRELQQYVMEMLDGILDFEIQKGNWEYTYHDRMVRYPTTSGEYNIDQISFVINELKRNPSSRRAVIMIRNSDDIGSDDPACLNLMHFMIRNNKLDCKVVFRSNDACKATFMNMFALIMIQKRIADELGVEVGTYTHRANSFHCYEKDIPMLEGYVVRIKRDEAGCCESYKDDWKEMMDDEIPDILKMVETLKNR